MKKFLLASVIAFGLVVGVQSASALTAQDAEVLISILGLDATKAAAVRALVSGGTTTTSSSSYTYTRDLTIGATGSDVTALQDFLISKGYLTMPAGVAKGYFGSLTRAALAQYQMSKAISPAVGYFGPTTRGVVQGEGTTTTTTTTTTTNTTTTTSGDLEGTDGSISDVNKLSQYNNEDVGDGESDVKIIGFEVEASNDGDIAVKSVKLIFTGTSNSGSTKLNDYVDSVSIWQGTTRLGTADVSDFNKDSSGVYSKTISFRTPAVVRADKLEKFYVTVDAVSNLDSTDVAGDAWTVNVSNIKYEDGSGVVTTETSAGDLTNNLDAVQVNFVSFSSASNTELKISTSSASPDADIVTADLTDNTDDVLMLVGKLKVDGTSDVTINDFPVTLTVAGTASDVDTVTGSITLKIGDQEFSESVSTSAASATITFDNIDFTIDAGDTVEFSILADINDIEAGTFAEGDSLTASLTSTNRDYMDVENQEGDQLSDSTEKSGTATGNAQEFRTSGIAVTLVSTNTSVAAGTGASDDQGTFTIKFKVMAIGDAVYISSLADAQTSGNTTGYTTVHVDRAGTATTGGTSVTIINVTDTDLTAAGTYMIEEGDSETFEVTTTVQLPAAGAGGQYRVSLGGIQWDTTATDATPDTSYTSNLDAFKTSYVGLN